LHTGSCRHGTSCQNDRAGLRCEVVLRDCAVTSNRREARCDAIAAAHHSLRLLGRCMSAWRRLWRAHARAVSHHDEDAAAAAVTHHRHHVLRTAIARWHRHVHEHCLPKVQSAPALLLSLGRVWAGLLTCVGARPEHAACWCAQTQKKRRAAAAHRRRLLRRGLEGFRQQLDRRAAKRDRINRSVRRCVRRCVLLAVWRSPYARKL
jgi:hypothetical protein